MNKIWRERCDSKVHNFFKAHLSRISPNALGLFQNTFFDWFLSELERLIFIFSQNLRENENRSEFQENNTNERQNYLLALKESKKTFAPR